MYVGVFLTGHQNPRQLVQSHTGNSSAQPQRSCQSGTARDAFEFAGNGRDSAAYDFLCPNHQKHPLSFNPPQIRLAWTLSSKNKPSSPPTLSESSSGFGEHGGPSTRCAQIGLVQPLHSRRSLRDSLSICTAAAAAADHFVPNRRATNYPTRKRPSPSRNSATATPTSSATLTARR